MRRWRWVGFLSTEAARLEAPGVQGPEDITAANRAAGDAKSQAEIKDLQDLLDLDDAAQVPRSSFTASLAST